MFIATFERPSPARRRRGGVVLVYVALMMPVLLGVAAMAVDMDYLYMRKAEAQKAADAAALAGAWCMANKTATGCSGSDFGTDVVDNVNGVAAKNGFSISDPKVSIATNCTTANTCTLVNNPLVPGATEPWVTVTITRAEPTFFSGCFGRTSNSVQAFAAAQYQGIPPTQIVGQATDNKYGLGHVNNFYSYEYFGPYGLYSNGDKTATIYTDGTGGTVNGGLNSSYISTGINFDIALPDRSTYATAPLGNGTTNNTNLMDFQIFDPTTTSSSSVDDVVGRQPGKTDSGYNGNPDDITKYTLNYVTTDASGKTTTTLVSTATYGDNDPAAVNTWVTPPGWTVDLSNTTLYPPGGNFQINVTELNGATGNGFNLRAGPPAGDNPTMDTASDTTWNAIYGGGTTGVDSLSTLSSDTTLPVNLDVTSTAYFELGYIPAPTGIPSGATNDGTVTVTKFDTDIGAKSLSYELVPHGADPSNISNVLATYTPSYTFQGSSISLNSGNGVTSSDKIVLPTSFQGGDIVAVYSAGAADNSQWSLGYSGVSGATGGSNSVMLTE